MSKQHLFKKHLCNKVQYSTVYRCQTIISQDGAVADNDNTFKMLIMSSLFF